MPLTQDFDAVTQYIYDMLNDDKVALGLQDVFYGDQELIPRTPSAVVEAGTLARTLSGVPFRVDHNFTVFVLLYHAKITDTQVTRKECNQLAVAIDTKLHTDKSLGGLVVQGFVTTIDPGYTVRGGALLRSARLTWQGMSKTLI